MPNLTRQRRMKSIADELICKSREAALAAIQIFNNPLISFKSELFIVIICIAWTYLLHAYYRKHNVIYKHYCLLPSGRRKYSKTKHGAYKHWELERCLNDGQCPIDEITKKNLRFLIGIRHEIEHQMTTRIDNAISAKYQACVLNYNRYLKMLFGDEYGLDKHLTFSLQLSSISKDQLVCLPLPDVMPSYIKGYINSFEGELTEEEYQSQLFSYRVLFIPKTANTKGQADEVIEFIKTDSELAGNVNKKYAYIKETERPKYLPGTIVRLMQSEGYPKFGIHHHTKLWQEKNAQRLEFGFGKEIEGKWYWYERWVEAVRKHCADNRAKYM